MNEQEVQNLLRELGQADFGGGPPPSASIKARAKRRRARVAALGSAAGIVVIAVSALAPQLLTDQPPATAVHQPVQPATGASAPLAQFERTWRVKSMAVFDPVTGNAESAALNYGDPHGLTLLLTARQWRAEIPCGYSQGRLSVMGTDLQHEDPVISDLNACPSGSESLASLVNLMNLMSRVRQWTIDGSDLRLQNESLQTIVLLAPTVGSSVDERALHDGEFCPRTLPLAPRETHGFGSQTSAPSPPNLESAEEAWLCTYEARDVSSLSAGGAWFRWVLADANRLSEERLAAFNESAKDLAPRSADEACRHNLGPRYMISFSSAGGDLTGVVIDGFGCHDVRLTDNPFVTAPGEASETGTVSGVLSAPSTLLHVAGID